MTYVPWRYIRVMAAAYFAEWSQYRAAFIIWIVGGTLPLVMMFVWIDIAESDQGVGKSSGYFIAYFFLIFLMRQLNPIWLIEELDRDVRLGFLSPKLLRPVHPYWGYLAYQICDNAIRLPLTLPLVMIGLWLGSGFDEISGSNIPWFVLAAVLGIFLHFNLELACGLLAFWTNQSVGMFWLYHNLYLLLGGALIPVSMFPDMLAKTAMLTPFQYVLAFPVQVALGELSGWDLVGGIGIQLFWIALIVIVGQLLWKRGVTRYSGDGS